MLTSTASAWNFGRPNVPGGGLDLGDANGDGSINALDSLVILQFSAGMIPVLPHPEVSDTSGNGSVDPLDALLILQFAAGMIDHFPAEVAGLPALWVWRF